ncbi:MAG: cytochrome ubiquinol oxidase subunit I [Gemmatimonadaceae bacterium]|nr:cytochrome ubiquinol oxidase subunit I [Gemmatimonadaceae bacterium]
MSDPVMVDRLLFAFTVTYHYLFPQLTMGLALLIFVLKTAALRTGSEHLDRAARFWARIFAINFAVGVVTGIPMEFQFGTNWAAFSKAAGGVIGQPLAMEGVFAFFLESSFLGLFLFGEKRLSRRAHWATSLAVFVGSWLSGYFIIATDAFMQHPVGYALTADGRLSLTSLGALLGNPWAIWQYLHNMVGAVITAAFVVAAVGAFYLLAGQHARYARTFLRLGVIAGVIASLAQVFPLGDQQGRMVADHQPATLAAMEGLFNTTNGAPLAVVGQPDMVKRELDNQLVVPGALSFLTYRRWGAEVQGLEAFPTNDWPDNVPLLYFAYHIMVGLGTLFIAITVVAAYKLWRGTLFDSKAMLWILMLSLPFPYIANTAGWLTAELGRQPWLVYGLLRTDAGASPTVSSGNGMFTLLGFLGLYLVLGILFLFLVRREIEHGPEAEAAVAASPGSPTDPGAAIRAAADDGRR